MARILIVDDDPSIVSVLTEVLRSSNYETLTAGSPARALELLPENAIDLVLADIEMPEGKPTGLKLLQDIKEIDRTLPVIMVTGQGTKERVVTALRNGAQDFVDKPFAIDELLKRVENALLQRRGSQALVENVSLKRQLRDRFQFENIIGQSQPMQAVYRIMSRVADTDCTVLILGESGTGKELVARALHYNSRRAVAPFIAINCAAMPEQLLESELFGHRKGAFTGAAFDKVGLFQAADGGTILLDEIGSMPLSLQTKLLRFLQDKEMRRVGDNNTVKVDVRVIAATNEPLELKIKDKTFREDLYYRVSVIPVQLPPLRDRLDDIPLLVGHFIREMATREGKVPRIVPDGVLRALQAYPWPGNVRELQNALERANALCDGDTIEVKDLPERLLAQLPDLELTMATLATEALPALSLREYLQKQEAAYIERAIRATDGDKAKAAEMLDVSPATLYRKLAQDTEQDSPA